MKYNIFKKSITAIGVIIIALGSVSYGEGEDLELHERDIIPGTNINASGNLKIRGEHVCPGLSVGELRIHASKHMKNEGLYLAGNDMYIEYGTEFVNTGTLIAGGNIYINGKKIEASGSYDKGLAQVNLAGYIMGELFAGNFHHVEEFIPKGFWCDGQFMVSLDEEGIKNVRLLLLNHQNKDGQSILMEAVARGKTDAIVWLLAQGVDVNLQDSEGDTAAHWAMIAKDDQLGTFRLIISHPNVDLSIKNNDGLNAWDMARVHPNPQFLQILNTLTK